MTTRDPLFDNSLKNLDATVAAATHLSQSAKVLLNVQRLLITDLLEENHRLKTILGSPISSL